MAAELARSAGPARTRTRRSANRRAAQLDLGELPAPILWVRGERSHPWPLEEDGVVVIPGTGHYVALDQPELLADAITAFIADLPPSTTTRGVRAGGRPGSAPATDQ